MPRPNKERTIGAEARLAERIAVERVARGWTYEDAALAVSEAGCAIHPSAVYKIEKAGRRITVNELAAFSEVWSIPIERLLYGDDAPSAARATRRRRLITGDVLAEVARIYQENAHTGSPTAAVGEHFGLASSTASLYVKRARDSGDLPLRD